MMARTVLLAAASVLCLTRLCRGDVGLRLPSGGVLYPRPSEIREVLSLDGVWNFKLDNQDQEGIRNTWFMKDIDTMEGSMLMPVPSSYNDITTSREVRDHVGWVWYDRQFFVPNSWKSQGYRVWMRFGSVNYFTQVWVNGKKVIEHEIGHLPFVTEVTEHVKFGAENKVTVAVSNVLGPETIPQGSLHQVPTMAGRKTVQKYSFDFFNYAGIHRSVHLFTTPKVYIDDIVLNTDFENNRAYLNYNLFYKGASDSDTINSTLAVVDKEGCLVCFETCIVENGVGNVTGRIEVANPKLWWPYLMHKDPGYVYTIEMTLHSAETGVTDVYRQQFGLRTVRWDNSSVYINDKPIYIRGFGRHEDSDIRGKGLDLPTVVKDHNLLKWIGANAYRTSHYPYAEEIMDVAESQGIMIIDESPSVNTENFTQILLEKHKIAMAELINRDKNRACVIMWSVANEPRTADKGAGPYFGEMVKFVRSLDKNRPVTAVIATPNYYDQAGQWMDVICFNRYNAWYTEPGQLESIQLAVESEAQNWREKHLKPVIIAEYGADTYQGFHSLPDYIWSEEYQMSLLSEHFKAFDNLRKKGWFIGEMIWNFADFRTDQSITRVGGNKKGIFTRQREPKSAAFLVRQRNFQLASKLDNAKPPPDLNRYAAGVRDEF